jgi:hypothetical protein
MQLPQTTVREVFGACLSGILNEDLKRRIEAVQADFENFGQSYDDLARTAQLFTVPANTQDDNEILIGRVTKGETKSLYSYYLVEKSKPGRVYYDALVASAPSGICPLCGTGYAITLDHHLPKGKFPLFSVLPNNLIPACRDCNTGKLAVSGTAVGDQSLHPYFDHALLTSEQWLIAEVLQTAPASIRFSVAAPANWHNDHKQRVETHFTSLKLGPRFSILAANELGSITGILNGYVGASGPQAVKDFLSAAALVEAGRYKNSWKTAMLLALAASDWFCEAGFRIV